MGLTGLIDVKMPLFSTCEKTVNECFLCISLECFEHVACKHVFSVHGPVSQKILSPLVILSMEKTMVTKVISELKSVSRLKIFRERFFEKLDPCVINKTSLYTCVERFKIPTVSKRSR